MGGAIRHRWRSLAMLGLALALAACANQPPLPGHPALWRVDGPHGERAWLFGTIHSLPRRVEWRTPAVNAALSASDRVVVEVAALDHPEVIQHAFAARARSSGLPRLSDRLPPDLRPVLARLMSRLGAKEERFANFETWASAIILARMAEPESDPANGIDLDLLRSRQGKPVAELEGADGQFAVFDAMPEGEQRAMLAATVREAEGTGPDDARAAMEALAEAWRLGDMNRISAETHLGLLADPALREDLYVRRNHAWAEVVARLLASGARPFVAVGAAHMAGEQGLPELLRERGFTVARVQ